MVTIPAPMQALERLAEPFSSPDWLYELKMDGYRCLAGVEPAGELQGAARVRLCTKSGADCGRWFPEVAEALGQLPGGPHVIDGEVCVLRPDGTSDFNALQVRARRRRLYPGAPAVAMCAFDLLVHEGERVMNLALVERKARLQALLASLPKERVMFLSDLDADAAIFHAMVRAGLEIEGVVAKRRDSPYRPGVRSADWLKIKRPGWQEGRKWVNR